MKSLNFSILTMCIAFSNASFSATEDYEKENFHLFVLAGQSNMAGRGKITEKDQLIHPRIFMLSKDGNWVPAAHPIHYDKTVAGLGLGKSFAVDLAERDPGIAIGLIPTACGGSPITSWEPSGYHGPTKSHPYDDALSRTRRAMKDGTLKAVLWHQGESDSKPELAPLYKNRLGQLINRFRNDLDIQSLPFVVGQLGQFPERPWSDSRKQVNAAHISIAEEMQSVEFVSSDHLSSKDDLTHFNSLSLKLFGKRYAKAYLGILESKKILDD